MSGYLSLLGHPIVDQREHVETDLKPTLRPVFTRQESVNILSYYQSPLADQGISYDEMKAICIDLLAQPESIPDRFDVIVVSAYSVPGCAFQIQFNSLMHHA